MKTTFGIRWFALAVIVLFQVLIFFWLATTDNVNIWPIRNTLQYHLLRRWWNLVGEPIPGNPGTLQGTIQDGEGKPIAGAWVLLSRWDGATYRNRSDADGRYLISVPADMYRPVAGAPGYQDVGFGNTRIKPGKDTKAEVTLVLESLRSVVPGRDLALGEATSLSCTTPMTATALRRQVTFDSGGQPNQLTLFYTPVTATTTSQLPLLLTIYPGPANTWDCASIPLAAAGYAVLGTGPAYTFELENDLDELQRLVEFARAGAFPGTDGGKLALLGGSYSSLHVQRLLQRDQNFQAALLLGPPTDLFDMRYRLEQGTYIPPFGLDKALIALGLPSHEPLRYFRYSGAYHVRPDFPPLAILHSRSDEVVPYQQSELLVKNLALVGATYEAHFFDGASHYLLAEEGDKDSLEIYRITLDFLEKYLR
ncbi:MAG: carboxypeptidase regulatory-like domain-containing protein [Anaerolineae bacterium]|nr:carboxypeptidase regulatory-like domain-containing protein [Anaerolineae bacterium]